MIFPNKYLRISESLLGLSALLLKIIEKKEFSIENLWDEFKKKYINNSKLTNSPNYQKFVYTLDFMYMCNMINFNEKGEIFNENFRTKDNLSE